MQELIDKRMAMVEAYGTKAPVNRRQDLYSRIYFAKSGFYMMATETAFRPKVLIRAMSPWRLPLVEEDNEQQRFVAVPAAPTSRVRATPARSRVAAAATRLSNDFWTRVLKFTSWSESWGGEPIPFDVAKRAAEIAESALELAPEPFVAPANDGSLLLQWDFPNGRTFEYFIEDIESWEPGALTVDGVVHEMPVSSQDELLQLLRRVGHDEHADLFPS